MTGPSPSSKQGIQLGCSCLPFVGGLIGGLATYYFTGPWWLLGFFALVLLSSVRPLARVDPAQGEAPTPRPEPELEELDPKAKEEIAARYVFSKTTTRELRYYLARLPEGSPDATWCAGKFSENVMMRLLLRPTFGRRDIALLEEALAYGRRAVADAPPGPERAEWARVLDMNLGLYLDISRQPSPDPGLIEERVRACRIAATEWPPHHPDRVRRLVTLHHALVGQFAATSEAEVLDQAIQVARDIVAATASDSRAASLSRLSEVLRSRYEHFGDLLALEEAVQVGRAAVEATGEVSTGSHELRVLRLALGDLHRRTRDPLVRDEADAIDKTLKPGTSRAAGESDHRDLLDQAYRNSSPEMMAEAIKACRKALRTAPGRGREREDFRFDLYLTLAEAWQTLSGWRDDPALLDQAIRSARAALACARRDEATRKPGPIAIVSPADLVLSAHEMLGSLLWQAYRSSGNRKQLAEAREHVDTEFTEPLSPAETLRSAVFAADLALADEDAAHALRMAELAAECVPKINSRRLTPADRQFNAAQWAGMPTVLAVSAIASRRPTRAVELLEQTRGVVLADSLSTRGDPTTLREAAPGLGEEFDRLREEFDQADRAAAGPGDGQPVTARPSADRRAELNRRWADLLTRIRRSPGLAGFLKPPLINQLRTQATAGPIVYVLAHRLGGHALVVTDDADVPVRTIDLPLFTHDAVTERVATLRTAHESATAEDLPASTRRTAQVQVADVLRWLWTAVTGPVLGHLGHAGPPAGGAPFPRLWWCPVGICAFLPLHAAEQRSAGTTTSALDLVMSSYTPTIRALEHARIAPQPENRRRSMLIVTASAVRGSTVLPGAARETESLRALVPAARTLPRHGEPARYDTVMTALRETRIAHFTCHGLADPHNPGASRLVLEDHEQKPLTVAGIAGVALPHAELAYLSACSTTDTAADYTDEAVTLATAFQLAGYRAVVGAPWPINDHAAGSIAHDFYAYLTANGSTEPDTAAAAAALHHALRKHRARRPHLPTQWTAYVHTGA